MSTTIASTALLVTLATAPPEMPSEPHLTHVIRGDVGLFSALGFLGVAYGIEPNDHLLVELGSGFGLSGLQLSFMPKLVLGSGTHRFTTGVGVSLSVPGVTVVTYDYPYGGSVKHRVITPWLNADLFGYDYRSSTGFSFAISAGFTTALASGCAESIDSCVELKGFTIPQLRLGIGRWF